MPGSSRKNSVLIDPLIELSPPLSTSQKRKHVPAGAPPDLKIKFRLTASTMWSGVKFAGMRCPLF
jgi:hypothetical protein